MNYFLDLSKIITYKKYFKASKKGIITVVCVGNEEMTKMLSGFISGKKENFYYSFFDDYFKVKKSNYKEVK